MNAEVYLNQAKQTMLRRNHPWIFPKAIAKTKGNLVTGELVNIYSQENEYLGQGVYNEFSLYRVRIIAKAHEENIFQSLEDIINKRLKDAMLLRKALNLPNEETNAYRLFNSEADGLSGLTIDRFDENLVIASSAYWVQKNKEAILKSLSNLFPKINLIWQSQQKPLGQDGWKELTSEEIKLDKAHVKEASVIFEVEFGKTQKTGLFLDQRENHQRIAAIAKGKKVLDLYSYTGGFALHAAKALASRVVAVDSSAPAIIQAKENALLNKLTNIEFIEADARDYLKNAFDFDIVILDPPKLVPSKKHLHSAKNYYRFLHREVFKAMKPGTILMTCNCSSALSQEEFCNLVSSQAIAVNKEARVLGVFGPASCHPVLTSFPEGNYLTAVLLAVL